MRMLIEEQYKFHNAFTLLGLIMYTSSQRRQFQDKTVRKGSVTTSVLCNSFISNTNQSKYAMANVRQVLV